MVFYLGASVGYLTSLVLTTDRRVPIAFWAAVGGFVVQGLSIIHRAVFSGFFPLGTPFDVLSFFAWLIVGFFLVLQKRIPSPVFGSIAAPIASVLMLLGSTFAHQIREPLVPILRSWWLPIHVILALAGNAVFALMAMGGVMYILQESFIKKKRIGKLHRLLPSLETLDRLNRHGLPLGFFLLTVGIISGALWAGSVWGFYWSWDPKETWSLITWFAYAAMVHQRLVWGWRGRRAAIFAIVGFGLVMFTFIGVSAFVGGHHAFRGPGLGAIPR